MDNFLKILMSLLLIWMMIRAYRFMRAHPENLNRKAIAKSFQTMGLLALALIAFVGTLVLLLRY